LARKRSKGANPGNRTSRPPSTFRGGWRTSNSSGLRIGRHWAHEGTVKALELEEYAARSRNKPETLQGALFSYLEAL
jgi:hypothetical protein